MQRADGAPPATSPRSTPATNVFSYGTPSPNVNESPITRTDADAPDGSGGPRRPSSFRRYVIRAPGGRRPYGSRSHAHSNSYVEGSNSHTLTGPGLRRMRYVDLRGA